MSTSLLERPRAGLAAARPGIRHNAGATGPSLVTTSGADDGTGASSYTITIPSGAVVGNLLLLFVTHRSGTSPATPTGWTYQSESARSAGARPSMMTLFSRVCQAGDPGANVTIGFGGSQSSSAIMAAYSGVDATYPLSTSAFTVGNGTGLTGPVIRPIAAPARVVHEFGLESSSGTDTGAVAFGAGVTLDRYDHYGPTSQDSSILGHEDVAAPGATTARSITVVNSSDIAGCAVALNPSGANPSSTAYKNAVLADSPLGFWMLGETSGTQMTDSSGNARHGTYNVLPSTTGRLINSATSDLSASLAGSNTHYGDVPYGSWLDQAGISVEFWLKNTGGGGGYLVGRLDPGDGIQPWNVYMNSVFLAMWGYTAAGSIYGPPGAGPSTVCPIDFSNGTRKYHVIVTHVGTDFSCFINGSLIQQQTGPSGIWSGGSGHGGLRIYDSAARTMEAVAIYSGGLTATQAQNHFAAAMSS